MATIHVRPHFIGARSAKRQCIDLTLSDAGWNSSTVFSLSGLAGCTKLGQSVTDGATARIVVQTKTSGPGTLTISDGTNSGSVAVKHVSPTRGRVAPRRPERLGGGGSA